MKYLLGMVNYTLLFLYSGKLGIIVKKDSNGQPRKCGKSRCRENSRSDDATFLQEYFVYFKKSG